jgi:hypothetical protein
MASQSPSPDVTAVLHELQQNQSRLLATVEALSSKLDSLAQAPYVDPTASIATESDNLGHGLDPAGSDAATKGGSSPGGGIALASSQAVSTQRQGLTSRIILTTYPKQIGINPLPLVWGNPEVQKRGPVVVLRSPSTIRRRNAVGAHGGSYSIYYALAVASKELDSEHRFGNLECIDRMLMQAYTR